MELKVKRLHKDAALPEYATEGAACFDLRTISGGVVKFTNTFRTGLVFEVPDDHVMLVFSRSGHGFKNDMRLANCVGVIDSDYRGEVMVKLTSDNSINIIEKGDRIAQALVIPVKQVSFVECDELSETVRGDSGLGSTGVK